MTRFLFLTASAFFGLVSVFEPTRGLAQEVAEGKPAEMVLPWFAVTAMVALGVMLLLRLTNRSETSLTSEEIEAEKQEQTKKH